MEIIRTVSWMKQVAREARQKEHVLGLVPTMGALHEGHISLIREAQKQCSPVAVSIFVNPKQFGPSEGFKKYPRTFEADCALLEKLGVDYLFAPSPEEMYPRDFRTAVLVEGLSDKLEGKSRPSHFRGVTTVVLKLFEIVQPRLAFFGRKDAQQVVILERMVRDLNLDVEIVTCPIIREPDGLALSSRNVYLQPDERRSALVLHRSLQASKAEIISGERNPAVILTKVRSIIAPGITGEPRVDLDYAEIVDAETLEPLVTLARPGYLLLAARVGSARLIDNARIEPGGPDGDGGFLVAI